MTAGERGRARGPEENEHPRLRGLSWIILGGANATPLTLSTNYQLLRGLPVDVEVAAFLAWADDDESIIRVTLLRLDVEPPTVLGDQLLEEGVLKGISLQL